MEKIIKVEPERQSEDYFNFCDLCDALNWDHYPTYYDAEEIDSGDFGDDAEDETIDVPESQMNIFNFLDECGVFDNL